MTTTDQPARKDNLFGVCAAVGEDFGFDPLWLRMAFAVALLFDMEHVLMAYAALGLLVLVSRLAFRTPTARPEPIAQPDVEPIEYRQAA
ncbi:PspC domain-containing protein [Sphingomonas adhaesiva]|uniref:PspC domain-containing protein n=1 Tax=Sphingomonas adhaesiva TaxID=28212 RepID=UPI002FF85D55